MGKIIPVTSSAPSIVIVREAYQRFFTPADEPYTAYYEYEAVGSVLTCEPQTSVVTAQHVEPWLKFRALVAEWRQQRGAMSSITEAALCPAYQSIIGMGQPVVPFILAELVTEGDEPDQWFWALKAITGADPVQDEDRGDFVAMAHAWLQWAQDQGYGG